MVTRRALLASPFALVASRAFAAPGKMTLALHQNSSAGAGYRRSLEGWSRAGVKYVEITPNAEVAEVVWAKVGPLARNEVAGTIEWERDGMVLTLPTWRVGELVVWGLTHRMLGMMFAELHG